MDQAHDCELKALQAAARGDQEEAESLRDEARNLLEVVPLLVSVALMLHDQPDEAADTYEALYADANFDHEYVPAALTAITTPPGRVTIVAMLAYLRALEGVAERTADSWAAGARRKRGTTEEVTYRERENEEHATAETHRGAARILAGQPDHVSDLFAQLLAKGSPVLDAAQAAVDTFSDGR